MSLGIAFLVHLGLAVLAVLATWRHFLRSGNAAWIDAVWASSIAVGALLHGILAGASSFAAWGLPLLMAAWGARLGAHLFHRVSTEPEDGRYATLKASWAERHGAAKIPARMLGFYLAQALLAALLALPAAIASRGGAPGGWAVAALVLGGVSLVGAHVADRQLAVFRADPRHRGRTCRAGLWRASRHPNYFFEILLWVSFALWATPSPGGSWAWLAPLSIGFFLLKVTGIPLTEEQALRSRGDDYRRYQSTTSPLIPWFPLKERSA